MKTLISILRGLLRIVGGVTLLLAFTWLGVAYAILTAPLFSVLFIVYKALIYRYEENISWREMLRHRHFGLLLLLGIIILVISLYFLLFWVIPLWNRPSDPL